MGTYSQAPGPLTPQLRLCCESIQYTGTRVESRLKEVAGTPSSVECQLRHRLILLSQIALRNSVPSGSINIITLDTFTFCFI